ncbi:hypothetical protein C1646_769599 [Rhizophagus diaphanus]|nr:hypothetical protein C1646_769599 [Rhizophagus diaphanus] [Rhizophagus sp. MUCL 43196]
MSETTDQRKKRLCKKRIEKVNLPPLLEPPPYLLNLYTSSRSDANTFCKNIRGYNSLLACTSFGAKINEEFQRKGDLDENILQNLQNMLDEYNPYVQNFRQIRDVIQANEATEISMLIHSD